MIDAAHPAGGSETATTPSITIPQMTFEEGRVFGCLIEKSQATPEYYPLTLNALTAACNQKSSREPVVDFDEDLVEDVLGSLQEKGLVAFASGTGRVVRYIHRAGHNGLLLSPAQACIISLLLLRGAQTPGELRTRAGRQHTFADLDAVQCTLESLMTGDKTFVEEAPRRPGQKEIRYRHRFFAYDPAADAAAREAIQGEPLTGRGTVDSLRATLEGLSGTVDALNGRFVDISGTMDGLTTSVDALRTLVEVLREEVRSLHDRVESMEALLK